jgi:glucose/arabinose dehydrogenase
MLALFVAAQVAAFNAVPPNSDYRPAFAGQTRAPEARANVGFRVLPVASGLDMPWSVAFLPDGRFLVTERPGRLRIVSARGRLSPPVAGLPAIVTNSQGGLLDVALAPDFVRSRRIYWSFSEEKPDGTNHTAVARGRLVDGKAPRLEGVEVIFRQTPSLASPRHYGSRLVFAPDGTLFVTLGERSIVEGRVQARRPDGLLGKIVRLNPDGSVPADNPHMGDKATRPEIWSRGHRNVQGAALHPRTGELWTHEHGPRGGDELNIARRGRDYGWPDISYGIEYNGQPMPGSRTAAPGLEQPVYYWDPIIAPSGMAFYTGPLFPAWQNSLFIGGLRSTALIRLTLDGNRVTGEERLLTNLGERIRDVRQGPDGALYLLTDSKQGRLLKLVPSR